jgi:protein-tyrosine-phosphatase
MKKSVLILCTGNSARSQTVNVPLATDVVRLLEDDWLEPVAPSDTSRR